MTQNVSFGNLVSQNLILCLHRTDLLVVMDSFFVLFVVTYTVTTTKLIPIAGADSFDTPD